MEYISTSKWGWEGQLMWMKPFKYNELMNTQHAMAQMCILMADH